MKHIHLIILSIAFVFFSCKKETVPEYNGNVKSTLSVEFDNIAGGADLALNSGTYTNASGETFTVTKLKYYVSNFVLINNNGDVYTVPQDSAYFLIDESNEAAHEAVLHVPEGAYKTLSFTLGIDSVRNTLPVARRTGVLDPAAYGADMYWSWNSGYIFFKMEGTSPASADGFTYHIGGFGGYSSATINNIKNITLDLSERGMPQVKAGKETNIHLMADVLKVFDGATRISIKDNPNVMFSPFSVNVANNYATMFRHDHTEN